jgi:hypothetical protein
MDEQSVPRRRTWYKLQESQDDGIIWYDVMTLDSFRARGERSDALARFRELDETCQYRMVRCTEEVLDE